jgi:hypothetical protein
MTTTKILDDHSIDLDEIPLKVEAVWDDQIVTTPDPEPKICEDNATQAVDHDPVNKPSHYMSKNGIESIDVIESFDLNFNLGNATKYILRSGKKWNRIEDLRKAIWYLEREIKNG